MKKETLKTLIFYIITSSIIYFLFLVIETISLYFGEIGLEPKYSILTAFKAIDNVLYFSLIISLILISAKLTKEKASIKIITFIGITLALIYGIIVFTISNNVIPEVHLKTYLQRYENARLEQFTEKERTEKIKDLKSSKPNLMSIKTINIYNDSLIELNKSQEKKIFELTKKIPDSVYDNKINKKALNNFKTSLLKKQDFDKLRSLNNLESVIRQNEFLNNKIKSANWEIYKRYLSFLIPLVLMWLGITIGYVFKSQNIISLICIGIVAFEQFTSLNISIKTFFIEQNNLISLLLKSTIIITILTYLTFKAINKNTGGNIG